MPPINNNDTTGVNRGVELILRRRETKPKETKKKFFSFLKKISFFKREIEVDFSISFTRIKKT